MKNKITEKYGGLKIIWQSEKLNALRKGIVTAPLCVRIKPTNLCDHHCFYCSYDPEAESKNILSQGFNRTDEIPYEKIMEILKDFRDIEVKSITFSGGGEPLVYPHIIEAFKNELPTEAPFPQILKTSAKTGEGLKELQAIINKQLEKH